MGGELIVGHINYANCVPFFHYLSQTGFSGQIVKGVPSFLNSLLAKGEIDVSPSSAFEYAMNWRDYLLLPKLSISSCGPVKSVFLFSGCPLDELEGREIALTGESATSVNMLQILLREFLGYTDFVCRVPERPVEEIIEEGAPALLIGDRALKGSRNFTAHYVYDLGELWYRFSGLPFVFALWILRKEAAALKRDAVLSLMAQLAESREKAFASLEDVARNTPENQWISESSLVDYWRSVSYDLTDDHLRGLKLFFQLSVKHGLLKEMPEINFFE